MAWPDRKVLAGGLSGLLTWILVLLANHYFGLTVPPEIQTLISGLVAFVFAYVIPSSVKDIVSKLNDDIIKIAAADPNSPVSERTLVLPENTKVVSIASPSYTVATPPALGPPPVVKTPEAKGLTP